MATRALILASEPMDFVFQNLLESIKEVGGTISSIDDKSYYLEGKTPSFRNHNVSDFKITLSVKKFGTLISILDEIKGERNRKFIIVFLSYLKENLKFIAPPTYVESQWIGSFKGLDDARRLLARWNHFRYEFNKLQKDETIFGRTAKDLMQTWEQIKEQYRTKYEDLSKKLDKAVEGIFRDHRNTINEYSFLIDVIGLLCPSVMTFMRQMDLTK